MPEQHSDTLNDIGVLVTRPSQQARPLATLIESHGGRAVLLPTIKIEAANSEALQTVIKQLGRFDIAIFISVNAVQQGLDRIAALQQSLPHQLTLACIGPTSASALKKAGFETAIMPTEKFNSESLLAQPALQTVAGKRIVIFRGEGGRELLATRLRARGAEVEYAECYRRVLPQTDTQDVEQNWAAGGINVVVITSSEGLQNLLAMLSDAGKQLLATTPIITISERTVLMAQKLGLNHVMVAVDSSDQAIIERLKAWHRKQKAL